MKLRLGIRMILEENFENLIFKVFDIKISRLFYRNYSVNLENAKFRYSELQKFWSQNFVICL